MMLSFGGAITQFDVFKKNLFGLKRLQRTGIKLTVFDGPNLCPWNGGRVNKEITLTEDMLNFYNKNDIGVNLTFSNNIIDTTNRIGNKLLDLISHNSLNGVILSDDGLRKYIRTNYSEMELTYSFTSDTHTTDEYLEIEPLYDYLVPKIHLFFDEDFYTRVDLSKYELWVDEQCIGCEKIVYHYNMISEINRTHRNPYITMGDEYCKMWNDCILPDYNKCKTDGLDYYNKDTIDKLIDIGYVNFKIPGRDFGSDRFDDLLNNTFGMFGIHR